MIILRSAVLLAMFVLLTACTSGGHDEHAEEQLADPVPGAAEVEIVAQDIDFQPATMLLAAGEPVNVTVTNDGEAMHDFTLEIADVHVNVEPGQSKTTSLTIDEPGTYEAVCTVAGHADAGMTIDVTVS
jgi:nitrite reductase (NO-forming)